VSYSGCTRRWQSVNAPSAVAGKRPYSKRLWGTGLRACGWGGFGRQSPETDQKPQASKRSEGRTRPERMLDNAGNALSSWLGAGRRKRGTATGWQDAGCCSTDKFEAKKKPCLETKGLDGEKKLVQREEEKLEKALQLNHKNGPLSNVKRAAGLGSRMKPKKKKWRVERIGLLKT